jgi:hypothetical protein
VDTHDNHVLDTAFRKESKKLIPVVRDGVGG